MHTRRQSNWVDSEEKPPAWCRHCGVFKGLSKKLGHGITKQQAPGILGEGRNLARITKGIQEAVSVWGISGQSVGSQGPARFRVTSALGRDTVKSHKDLHPRAALTQAGSCDIVSATKARGQRLGCLTDGDQVAPKGGGKTNKSIRTGEGQISIVRIQNRRNLR